MWPQMIIATLSPFVKTDAYKMVFLKDREIVDKGSLNSLIDVFVLYISIFFFVSECDIYFDMLMNAKSNVGTVEPLLWGHPFSPEMWPSKGVASCEE